MSQKDLFFVSNSCNTRPCRPRQNRDSNNDMYGLIPHFFLQLWILD